MTSIPAPLLQLGDPRLREVARAVDDVHDASLQAEVRALSEALRSFQAGRGFGRAISAPQIGVSKRFLVVDAGGRLEPMLNPEITWRSEELFTMWDDCMSFPALLVRVRRHGSISVRFTDAGGDAREWSRMDRAMSELLQHEFDHLDGVLAIDRAHGDEPFVTRAVFEAASDRYLTSVDYVIPSPAPSDRPRPPA